MGKITICDKIMTENQKKIWKSKKLYINFDYKRSFRNGIHSLLKQADARESADIIYLVCDAYR